MQSRLMALLALLLIIAQEATCAEVSLTSQTVVGNILYENMAAYALAVIMLVVATMI